MSQLSDLALQCSQLLEATLQSKSQRKLDPGLLLELSNLLTRLRIWAGYVGASAPGNASIDHRLRDDADVAQLFASLFVALKRNIEFAINPPLCEEEGIEAGAEERASLDSSTHSSATSSLELDSDAEEATQVSDRASHGYYIQRAANITDRLYRLSAALKKPASSSENSRIRRLLIERPVWACEDLDDVRDHVQCHLNARFEHASNILIDRLVSAAEFRRLKLCYRRRHRDKLRQGSETYPMIERINPQVQFASTPASPQTGGAPSQGPQDNDTQMLSTRRGPRSEAFSGTTASSVDRQCLPNYARTSAPSEVTRSAVARRKKLDVPQAPGHLDKVAGSVECPYCFRWIKAEETQEPRWTRHILKDLDPYVCLFDTCREGDVLFSSSEEWLGHMQWRHTLVWACQAPGHENHRYDDESDLEAHLRTDHARAFTQAQRREVIQKSAIPSPDTFAVLTASINASLPATDNPTDDLAKPASEHEHQCPLCLQSPPFRASLKPNVYHAKPYTDVKTVEDGIQNHILGHLEALALISLPALEQTEHAGNGANLRQSMTCASDFSLDQDDDHLRPAATDDGDVDSEHAANSENLEHLNQYHLWDYVSQVVRAPFLPEPNEDALLLKFQTQMAANSPPEAPAPAAASAIAVIGLIAKAIAVVELTAKVGSLCLEYSSAVKSARSDIKRLRKHTDTLKTTAEGVQELLQGPYGARLETSQKLREALSNTCSQLGDVATKLEEKLHKGHRAKMMRRVGLRAFGWPFESKDVDKIIANLQRDQDSFSAALQIDQTTEILDIHSKIDLTALPVASGAASDSHAEEHNARCHPDTRTKLLRQIREWASDPQAENIFWLNGMAGTGKSTISRTVATSFAKDGLLGASFFFKRGEGDRGNAGLVFPTIARQLVHKIPALVPSIREAIDADPDIPKRALRDQFEKLILHPLGCIQRTTAIVVIIDALDECDGDKDVKTIISLFAQASVVRSVRLRIFITSRPELPIRLGFKDVQGKYQGLALHQIPEQVVEQDISTFLAYELTRIKDEYNGQVPLGWPGENDIRTLAQMAVPLFIFAATVCRFVDDQGRSNPAKRLKKVLEYRTAARNSTLDKLDATYLPVLDQLTSGRTDQDKAEVLAEFRSIVGPIILLAQPLSVRSLGQLLDVECENVHALLNSLHSVLDIPSVDDAPVRLFHLSFRDFLVDPAKRTKNEFWIDEAEYHKTLTERCIQLMDQCLGQDICCLKVPGMLRSELDQQTINAHLPPEVQYACQYWVHHLKESKHNIEDDGPAHAFLTNHLLHWLEVLSLLGRLSDGVLLIRTLLHAAQPDTAPNFVDFLNDAEKFIRSHGAIMERAPLQIYGSALVFSPTLSRVRKQQWKKRLSFIKSVAGINDHWGTLQQTLEGHSHWVTAVAFSADGKTLASGSGDKTIRLWDAVTGTLQQTLEGHSGWVTAVAFSADGKTLASGSGDMTIRLWDAVTGTLQQTLEGHSHWVTAVAFSADGKTLASGSDDETIRLWDAVTGTLQQTLEGHSDSVTALALSLDGNSGLDASKNQGLGGDILFINGEWITRGGKNLLWLPPNYRATCTSVYNHTLVLGHASGQVTFLQIVSA